MIAARQQIPEENIKHLNLLTGGPRRSFWIGLKAQCTVLNALSLSLLLTYIYLFCENLSPYWFNAGWTSDDALQQVFPFHKVLHPELFQGDLITKMMECYLAPIHYWICYGITFLVGDPILMTHWVTLIQIATTAVFLFLAVHAVGGITPACFAVAWLLHTRLIIQRMTAGLPRGWSAVVFAAFLYCAVTKRHRGVLLTIAVGCLLHPPATFLVSAAYGLWLAATWLVPKYRKEATKPLVQFLVLAPFFAALTLSVTRMPPEIGEMASYEVASQMPEFQDPGGRFPFVPLKSIGSDLKTFGFQAFVGRLYSPGRFLKRSMWMIVLGLGVAIVAVGLWRKRKIVPAIVWWFLVGGIFVYLSSRVLAFRLYVPNRHVQFPLAFFFITFFSVGVWSVLHRARTGIRDSRLALAWPSAVGLLVLAGVIGLGSGSGLYGDANFNFAANKRGGVFRWLREHTPPDAIVAGHPTFIDPVQLFAMRQGFVTTETAHPFYSQYNIEMRRRLDVALRANYAPNLKALVDIVSPEGVDYFVFERKQFYPKNLLKASYYIPFNDLVKNLTSGNVEQYAYRELPVSVDLVRAPYMPYRDAISAVVDINSLREFQARSEN